MEYGIDGSTVPLTSPLTKFRAQNKRRTFPFHDPNRIYSDEHDITVHGCGVTPNKSTSVMLYDLPQRRWYELNIDRPMPLVEYEEEFAKTVILRLETSNDFNVININQGIATYCIRENVGWGMYPPIVCASTFPLVSYTDVLRKKYLRFSVDTCVWNGQDCVYKQLEFDTFVRSMQREIR